MTREDIIRMAREAGFSEAWLSAGENPPHFEAPAVIVERFANLVAAAERNSAAAISVDFARKWWSLHCATNKNMEITLMAHNDFCALQSAILARGKK